MTKLIVGLGNPGKEYNNTRHNIGFMVIDHLVLSRNLKFDKKKFDGIYTEEQFKDEKIIYLKPQRYMNLSGEVVKEFVNYFKILKEDILIISDDVNLPLGKIRLRLHGSSGGHNGLKNIELNLGSQEYKRMRFGIGSNNNHDMKDYVLGHFNKDEIDLLNSTFIKSDEILSNFLVDKFEDLMCKYN